MATETTPRLRDCLCGHPATAHEREPGTPMTKCERAACGCLIYRPDSRADPR